MTPTLPYLRTFRDDIIAIANKHGASNVRVFGSVVRNDANSNSDIDFLVDQDWTQLSRWGGMGLIVELEDLLNCKVDVATVDELKPLIRDRALSEAIPL